MSKVDFYILSQSSVQEQMFFACRLIEKIVSQEMKIHIHTDTQQFAEDMDDLLWSFRPDSFIPHALIGTEEASSVAVTIGHQVDFTPAQTPEVLINLSSTLPPFHPQFSRIVEIVINDENAKRSSREHWQSYKTLGYELKHNKV